MWLKVGDRVLILRPDIKDKPSNIGTIIGKDGEYLLVRFYRTRRVVELYPNEVEKMVSKQRKKTLHKG